MNCRKVQQYLLSFYEKDLSEDIKKEIEMHLKRCKRCAKEAKEYSELSELVKNIRVLEPSKDFNKNLLAEAEKLPYPKETEELKPQTLFPGRWAIATSAVVLLLLSIIFFNPLGLFNSEKIVFPEKKNLLVEADSEVPQERYYQKKPTTFVMDNLRLSDFSHRGDRTAKDLQISQFVIERKNPQFQPTMHKNYYVIPVVSSQVIEERKGF